MVSWPGGIVAAAVWDNGEGMPETARIALESKLRKRLLGERQDGAFTLQARAWAVRGVVPAR